METNSNSHVFRVQPNVYADLLKVAGRMFYYNRCNAAKPEQFAGEWNDTESFLNPLQDANCRYIYDPSDASLERDLRGGWFDAGDYNKYVTFAASAIHDLLTAYEENPQAFGDDWNTGWPESSWEITEPAIYYQAAYLRLLSHFTSLGTTSINETSQVIQLEVYPNPSEGEVFIQSEIGASFNVFDQAEDCGARTNHFFQSKVSVRNEWCICAANRCGRSNQDFKVGDPIILPNRD